MGQAGPLDRQRRGVITGGTWCVDRNRTVESWPAEERLAEILSEERRGGGSACNLAVDFRKLEPALPVETIGIVGDDDDGRLLLGEADAHEVDRTQMTITIEPRRNIPMLIPRDARAAEPISIIVGPVHCSRPSISTSKRRMRELRIWDYQGCTRGWTPHGGPMPTVG